MVPEKGARTTDLSRSIRLASSCALTRLSRGPALGFEGLVAGKLCFGQPQLRRQLSSLGLQQSATGLELGGVETREQRPGGDELALVVKNRRDQATALEGDARPPGGLEASGEALLDLISVDDAHGLGGDGHGRIPLRHRLGVGTMLQEGDSRPHGAKNGQGSQAGGGEPDQARTRLAVVSGCFCRHINLT
jgi:hypothetical protein